jgi:drug/metabolite transporter (DMT)-like permease
VVLPVGVTVAHRGGGARGNGHSLVRRYRLVGCCPAGAGFDDPRLVVAHCLARERQGIPRAVILHLGRIAVLGSLLISLALVAILHLVRVDLAPVGHRLSEYANGPHGWMMTTAFLTLGLGLVTLGIVLRVRIDESRVTWIIPLAAFIAGLGMVVAGLFRTGGSEDRELIHSRASALATVAIVVLALAFTFLPGRHKSISDPLGIALAVAGTVFVGLSSFFHETRWTGLSQRILWLALLVWLLRTAWRVRPEEPG